MKTTQFHSTKNLLTSREQEIIRLITQEYSTKEIAQQLYLSFETVKSHRHSIMNKLNVKNVAGIVREAFLQNIISLNTNYLIA